MEITLSLPALIFLLLGTALVTTFFFSILAGSRENWKYIYDDRYYEKYNKIES